MVPMQARQLRLHHTSPEDTGYLCNLLTGISNRFGAHVEVARDGALELVIRDPAPGA